MRSFVLSVALLALGACSAQTSTEEQLGTHPERLIGGHVAVESEYPATVSLGGCTGTKVGPRHFLSAGHCFTDPTQKTLNVSADNNAQNFQTLSVLSVNVHPEYKNCSACNGDSWHDFGLKPDVALIIVAELTPSIPVAPIDTSPVAYGDAVTLTGYGCENGVGQPSGPSRFKVGDTVAIDPLLAVNVDTIPPAYVVTNGPQNDPSAPGLCPGDSGGPLYRTGTNKVVGVNALVSFGGDLGMPYNNWHTRVDTQSRYNVNAWLTTLINQPVSTPCSGICSSPTVFTRYYANGYLGTGASCFETTAPLMSGTCGGFVSPRTLKINGTTFACNSQNWTLPTQRNGGYCISVTAGNQPWAWFSTW